MLSRAYRIAQRRVGDVRIAKDPVSVGEAQSRAAQVSTTAFPVSSDASQISFGRFNVPRRCFATASKPNKEKLSARIRIPEGGFSFDLTKFPQERIRNFCITAHIDHGKTTLSTRLLENTKTIYQAKSNELYLDKLRVEKERGITVKAQTVTMFYKYIDGDEYLLNLIDTPGHVDFNYEVSRSMNACEGALLLVDAVKGVQAQTVANWFLAIGNNLKILPVVNKIDLPTADVPEAKLQMQQNFEIDPQGVLAVSAASGLNVDEIFPALVERIPPPVGKVDAPLKALLFDSWYGDIFSGVICLVKIVDGKLDLGDTIVSAASKKVYEVIEMGIMHPEMCPIATLQTGQVGYLKLGMKSTSEARVGDTFFKEGEPVEPLPGFKPAKPMVFAGIYPDDAGDFDKLREAVEKLCLTDASVTLVRENNDILGMGYKCGFLGLLHMDVFLQRLNQEYGTNVIATAPNVTIHVVTTKGEKLEVTAPSQWPDPAMIASSSEPMVTATIITPKEYFGPIMTLCNERRGTQQELKWPDDKRVMLVYKMPLSEIIFDFFDKLKQISSGYATLDYEECGYEESNLVKMTCLVNGEPVDPLSVITHRSKVVQTGKNLVSKLKDVIARQMFEIKLQAAVRIIGGKIIARETIKALRKDVTAKCYGGDITRKRKLLEKQREGKKKMRQVGEVHLSQEAFLAVTKLGD